MKRHLPILLVCSTVVALSFGCNGADEITGVVRPKKTVRPNPPDPGDPRIQPVVVEESRDPVEVPARRRASGYPCVVVSNDSAPKNKPCEPCDLVRVGLQPKNKPCI